VRITRKGQVTIPRAIREKFGLLPNTEVEFVVDKDVIQIVKSSHPARSTRGETLVRRLRGTSTVKMSTDEILALTRR
jgi:antitoxin PrlF